MARYWPGVLLALLLGVSAEASAQGRPPPPVEIRENFPNPFFPSTTIPFVLSPELCEGGHQPLVSVKIYNVLVQVMAVPILLNSNGEKLDNLRLRCGEHAAFWDGKVGDGTRDLTPGVYYAQFTVDGERYTLKVIAQQ
jgi:hypothetical protein